MLRTLYGVIQAKFICHQLEAMIALILNHLFWSRRQRKL